MACGASLLTGCVHVAAQEAARDEVVGLYHLRDSFEVAMLLELRADGTYSYELAVGAKDERSIGTWSLDGNRITLVTTPKPVAPLFEQVGSDPSPDAPFLLVTWPNGNALQGVDVILHCAGGEVAYGYTLDTGWPYPENEDGIGGDGLCADPQTLRLVEGINDIASPEYDVAGVAGGLRFVLHPNDLGLRDMTGWQATITGDTLLLAYEGSQMVEMVRYRAD
ncbi:hypothetical protein M3P36_03910 [Altererythrobacter sp. KTW20L]|uniref:hypothetical protein n=1 Tax=Altererythrobacter sp. KTW20L TaxID=2942210 RepID=UPI0020C00D8D|nr:hypothetical protein [Altererythrobacter sp. KTW20L]MCL6250194.1 hypothetical protein [Altererythrobacter sp. KTW20L]